MMTAFGKCRPPPPPPDKYGPRSLRPTCRNELTLADAVMSCDPWLTRKIEEQVQRKVREARKFVLDREASANFATALRDIPDLLLREHAFARAPYDVTWVEYDFPIVYEIVNDKQPSADSACKVGYLFDHNTAYVVISGPRLPFCMISPIVYDLHTEFSLRDQLVFADLMGTSRAQIDDLFWGRNSDTLDERSRRALRDSHSVHLLPLANSRYDKEKLREAHSVLFRECQGELRNMLALLLLMNRPAVTTFAYDVPRRSGIFKGKLRSFYSYTVVTIKADPVPTLRLLGTSRGEGVERRRHEVRGHWCHSVFSGRSDCVHTWQARDDSGDSLDCVNCGKHRWWRNSHMRGSSTLGYVHQEHRLDAARQGT